MSTTGTMNNNGYATYQNMVSQVSNGLTELSKLCAEMNLEENKKDMDKYYHKMNNHAFSVGIMGEFKRGKSTVINSLLEKEIMPADILPCSATMNRVTYDMQPRAELKMQDGSVRQITVDELASYVTKLTAESESRAEEVEEAVVYYPCRFCQNGVDIVDTPGLNDDERMNRISEEVIPKLDVVIMVLTHDNPFSMSEAEFVRGKLMTSDLSRLIFLVNKMDMVRRESDKARVIESIREKIHSSVLKKTEDMYGKDSKQYRDVELKLGNIRIYPFSALDALEGKMEGDQALIEKSGTAAFEEMLTKMLTEERGALELSGPLNAIQRCSVEVIRAAEIHKNAMELSTEEFEQNQKEALEKIRELREMKKDEKKRLRESAVLTTNQLVQEVTESYAQIEERLYNKADEICGTFRLKELTEEGGQNAAMRLLQEGVNEELETSMAMVAEKIQVRMDEVVGQEALEIGKFMENVSLHMDDVRMNFSTNGGMKTNILGTTLEAFSYLNGLYGVGGALAGYRCAGIKGAIVGGGAGMIGTLTAAGVFISLSLTSLPFLAIAAAAGTLTGKFAAKKLFGDKTGEKELSKIRNAVKDNVSQLIKEMQGRRDLENWTRNLVDTRFDELIQTMEEDCERLLKDTEASMDAIKQELTESEMNRKQMEEKYNNIMEEVKQINDNLQPVAGKVCQVLECA